MTAPDARGATAAGALRRRCLMLVPMALLAACASRPPPVVPGLQALSGRMSLRIAAHGTEGERAVALAFDLRGRPEAGQIEFSTPLGSIVAKARWAPGEAWLITPQGEQAFPDLDSLSREALGEALPLAAWFDWLQGRPWPEAASEPDRAGVGFSQLGWKVDLARLADSQISASREQAPAVAVRVRLDSR